MLAVCIPDKRRSMPSWTQGHGNVSINSIVLLSSTGPCNPSAITSAIMCRFLHSSIDITPASSPISSPQAIEFRAVTVARSLTRDARMRQPSSRPPSRATTGPPHSSRETWDAAKNARRSLAEMESGAMRRHLRCDTLLGALGDAEAQTLLSVMSSPQAQPEDEQQLGSL